MKILITGSGGMLGSTLTPYLKDLGHNICDFPREKLDVTDYNQVELALSSIEKLDLVIHCAAYTQVDQAEAEPDLAYSVNGYATENLAVICNKLNLPML